MSGPRITTGAESKQDYRTPSDFMAAVARRFGPVQFDLAAHAGNAQHTRYFAPAEFVAKVERGKTDINKLIADVVAHGASEDEARRLAFDQWSRVTGKGEIVIPNLDERAFGLDAFTYEDLETRRRRPRDWASLSHAFSIDGSPGLLWLNCEFADITPWAEKCSAEGKRGANITLLTPAVFANWHRDHIAGVADVYELSGRLSFDGKNVFPKDCRLSHFWPGATGKLCIWEWATDRIHAQWSRTFSAAPALDPIVPDPRQVDLFSGGAI